MTFLNIFVVRILSNLKTSDIRWKAIRSIKKRATPGSLARLA